jgi:hypothetical protein
MTTEHQHDISVLPGEDGPVLMRWGRGPITEAEALGVARRVARKVIADGRTNTKAVVPDELPASGENQVPSIFRLPPRTMAFVKARAEAEGVTVTDVVRAALDAYATGRPGTPTIFEPGYPNQ